MNFPRQENSSMASFCLVAVRALTNYEREELSQAPVQPGRELESCLESLLKSL